MTAGPPVGMTIAGSDSGAGAGIQADIKAMAALGVFATTAVTAVTAQNTVTVADVHHLPAAFVEAQIDALLDDLPVAAVKTGMLGTLEIIEMVGRRAAAGDLPNLVVDPVMVASTGRALLGDGGVPAYCRHILPYALVVTPNLHEAALLAGTDITDITDIDAMVEVARRIHEWGPAWVLVKGGHLAEGGSRASGASPPSSIPDVLTDGTKVTVLTGPYVDTRNTHGTGCTLSAAIAARLASGADVPRAVADAKQYVHRALVGGAGWHLGSARGPRPSHGPLDHLGWSDASTGEAVPTLRTPLPTPGTTTRRQQ